MTLAAMSVISLSDDCPPRRSRGQKGNIMIDRELAKEIRKANGDGSRDAKFELLSRVKAANKDLSTPNVIRSFNDTLKKHGRVPVAICIAVTAVMREDRLNRWIVDWGREVLRLWSNRPNTISVALIDDNLHPTRIEEYAKSFVDSTTE